MITLKLAVTKEDGLIYGYGETYEECEKSFIECYNDLKDIEGIVMTTENIDDLIDLPNEESLGFEFIDAEVDVDSIEEIDASSSYEEIN